MYITLLCQKNNIATEIQFVDETTIPALIPELPGKFELKTDPVLFKISYIDVRYIIYNIQEKYLHFHHA